MEVSTLWFLLVSLNYNYTINVFKTRRVSFGKFTQVKLILQRVWWIRPSVRGGHRFCFFGTAPEIPNKYCYLNRSAKQGPNR